MSSDKNLQTAYFTASANAEEFKQFDPAENLIKLEQKLAGDDTDEDRGIVAGYMSVWNNIDQGGDIIRKGAFKKTLAERRPIVLWQHSSGHPIGQIKEAYEDSYGLFAVISLNLKTSLGKDAYELIKAGDIHGFSIGYKAVKFDVVRHKNDTIGRELKELSLWEVSVVTFPMNELAVVTQVKNELDELLETATEQDIETVKQAESIDDMIAALAEVKARREQDAIDFIEAIKAIKAEKDAPLNYLLEALKSK